MKPSATHALFLVAFLAVAALPAACGAGVARIEFADGSRSDEIETTNVAGTTFYRVTDLTRVTEAIRHRNRMTGKETLVVGDHRISMCEGNQFVTLDGAVMNVRWPVGSEGGSLFVPPAFLTDVLSKAFDAEIGIDPGGTVVVRRIGPEVAAPVVADHRDGTAIVFGLSWRAEFHAESAGPGAVSLLIPGGRLLGPAGTFPGRGLVSSIELERSDAGVRATIEVAGAALAYSAEILSGPPRIEVIVEAGGREGGGPRDRDLDGLGPFAGQGFGRRSSGVRTVMIDPGHGGIDAGATGPSGLLEKDVSLALARELSAVLAGQGFSVFMTRSGDDAVPIKRRAEIANVALADLFVSVQCDASFSATGSGFRVTYHRPTRSRDAADLLGSPAGLRRVRRGRGQEPYERLLWSRAQDDHVGESALLAELVRGGMGRNLPLADRGLRAADVVVLSGCAMPAVLVEVGCLTSPTDEALLSGTSFLRSTARAIAGAVVKYREMSPGGRSL